MSNERDYFFKEGNTYGQKGRPKKERFSEILNKLGEKPIPQELSEILKTTPSVTELPTCLEAIMQLVVIRALKGDKWAIGFIAERTEGRAGIAPVPVNTMPPLQIVLHKGPEESFPNNSLSQEDLPQDDLSQEGLPKIV